ncbi:MAG TPA: GNAT family N-acetyltransferase [Tepidisphaeraceae bacterium]|jgi:hypothetical protein|nr:GNAT family N-acetyltransferase [Tepidisphaeraceae bacterium]
MRQIIPIPRVGVSVRAATMSDLPFIDGLQKMHTKMVGWMPTKALEGKVRLGHVLVAEERSEVRDQKSENAYLTSDLRPLTSVPVGYCIGNDQYFKRDDVGIIYQMNVAPGKQRGFVGATLVKAMFERAAWGCKLFCCWCAQDIAANHFWESLGFVPLAFRTGSRGKGAKGGARVHIFWQRRIREGDTTTPYWFPSQTSSGAIREDRLVLPIPPGVHWSDAKPVILPGEESTKLEARNSKQIATTRERVPRSKIQNERAPVKALGGWGFVPPKPDKSRRAERKTTERVPRPKVKNDPRLIAAARELRDCWLEKANSDGLLLESRGKYEVSRPIETDSMGRLAAAPRALLRAA